MSNCLAGLRRAVLIIYVAVARPRDLHGYPGGGGMIPYNRSTYCVDRGSGRELHNGHVAGWPLAGPGMAEGIVCLGHSVKAYKVPLH